jgi:D-serine dehydratase
MIRDDSRGLHGRADIHSTPTGPAQQAVLKMEPMHDRDRGLLQASAGRGMSDASGSGVEWILDTIIDESCKAWPPHLAPRRLRDIGSLNLNLYRGDLPSPVAILREDAIDANEQWMKMFLASAGALLCPHGKTTMAPQLFMRQIEHGAWGMTVATRHQLGIACRAGVRKVILANEIVAASDMHWIAAELERTPDLELYAYVDSVRLVESWAALRRRRPGRPICLLLEVGFMDGRTGARTLTEAIAVAEGVRAAPDLRLAGIAGFEGIITGNAQMSAVDRVRRFLDFMVETARECERRGLFEAEPVILSAGGSAYYDLVAEILGRAGLHARSNVVLRCGCYLTHDHRFYQKFVDDLIARSPASAKLPIRPRPALEVWSMVQSRPQPDLMICTMGKRDVGSDIDLPRPIAWCRPNRDREAAALSNCTVVALNDQHAIVRIPPDSELGVGDLVGFGMSHPCTTFDRWPLLYMIASDGSVLGGISTFF